MVDVAERLTCIPLLIGLFGLFTLTHSAPGFENGILPHFKVDHRAGKLKISASRDSADISYKNDNVDLTVKPNNKEQAKVVIDSMRDSEMGKKVAAARRDETERGTARSIKDKPLGQRLHLDSSYVNDIGMRRSKVQKHNEVDDHERKGNEGSDITWRGRINHSTDEPDNNHVLSALNEIKSLMTLSMKPPNLKAFDQVLPVDSTDKYLNTPDVVKKLNHAEHKKRRPEATQDSQYVRKAKHMVHNNLRNGSYNEEPVGFTYPAKGPYIHVGQRHARKNCKGARCRVTSSRRHPRKNCAHGRCRQDIFGTPEVSPDGAFEELYLGKIKEHHHDTSPLEFRNRDPDYDTLGDNEEQPHHKTHKGTAYVAPYHSQNNDEGYHGEHGLYGDEDRDHHQEMDGFHGGHEGHEAPHSSSSNGPDSAFEKDFESKINDKEYNDDGQEVHHASHHAPTHDEDFIDEGDHYPHGDADVNEMGLYEHQGDSMGELPSETHHLHNNYHDMGEHENQNRNPSNYDFDEAKEIKDEDHEDQGMEHLNGKLKDWYTTNAIGSSNATNQMDEPLPGEAEHHAATGKDTHPEANKENATSSDDKKSESKFENAGEKPLNSTQTDIAISKLNESLANSLNVSTMNAISSFGNGTNTTDNETNSTTAALLNSFNNLKLDGNTTENAQPNDNVESSNKTNESPEIGSEKAEKNISGSNFNMTHETIKLKISSLEKKVNSSGDLLKQLESIEKQLNKSAPINKTTEALKKPLTNTEKELLRVTPEDILQTHLPSSDDLEVLHDANLARHLNSSASSEKNGTTNTTGTGHKTSAGIEKIYASIGELEKNMAEANKNATEKKEAESKNGTHTDEGSADGSGAGLHAEKHAELKHEKEEDITKDKSVTSEQTYHKTKVYEKGGLKRHKTKVFQSRRHKVHTGSKRHHKSRRHGQH